MPWGGGKGRLEKMLRSRVLLCGIGQCEPQLLFQAGPAEDLPLFDGARAVGAAGKSAKFG